MKYNKKLNFLSEGETIQSALSALHKSFAKLLTKIPRRVHFAFLLLSVRERKKLTRGLTIAATLTILSLAFISFHAILGQSYTALSIGSQGTVKATGVGVYLDGSCSNAVSFVDWGTNEPGSTKNITVYIRNEGNGVITLFLGTDNWTPSNASNYMALSWDYAGQPIGPQEVVQIALTLSTSPDIEGITNFSFDIIIDAIG